MEWTALRLQTILSQSPLPMGLGTSFQLRPESTFPAWATLLKSQSLAYSKVMPVLGHGSTDLDSWTPQLDFRLLSSWKPHLLSCAWPMLPSWDLIPTCRLSNLTCRPPQAFPMTCTVLNLNTTSGLPFSFAGAAGLAGKMLPCWLWFCFQLLASQPSLYPDTAFTAMKQLNNVKKIVLILGLYTFFKNLIFQDEYRDPALIMTHVIIESLSCHICHEGSQKQGNPSKQQPQLCFSMNLLLRCIQRQRKLSLFKVIHLPWQVLWL